MSCRLQNQTLDTSLYEASPENNKRSRIEPAQVTRALPLKVCRPLYNEVKHVYRSVRRHTFSPFAVVVKDEPENRKFHYL
jgi:hypothetical protein